jgi:Flp pilus assembly protein TadB
MLATLACALTIGLGLCYAVTAMLPKAAASRPHPTPYTPSHRPAPADTLPREGALTRAAVPLVPWFTRLGLPREPRRCDLALLERDTATHLAQQIATSLALALLGSGLFAFLHADGLPVPPVFLMAFVGVPALYGFTAPSNKLKTEAAAHRDALRQTTGSFLTLAGLALAAGGNINEALATASQAGRGPAAAQLRGAIAYAESSGTPAWDALAELGRRADVTELTELAAAVSLAGHEGARLRATLSTKSKALRERQLAAREAAEIAATEKTALPTTLMMLGYLLLVATPAAATAMHAL